MQMRRPDRFEVASFTFVFYVVVSVFIVGFLAAAPSIISFLVNP